MRDGSAWSPYFSTSGGGPGLADGEMVGPRIGPRIFREVLSPNQNVGFLQYRLVGTAVDDAGLPLPGATVDLYDTATKVLLQTQVADGLGVVAFTLGTGTQQTFAVAYKAGAADVYGTTPNTLVGS